MQTTYQVQPNEHVPQRPFDEVVQAFERAVGSVEGVYPDLVARSHDTAVQQLIAGGWASGHRA